MRSRWRGVLLLALAILLPFCGIALWIDRVVAAKWARMEARLRELQARQTVEVARMFVLRGFPQPGNSWEEYSAAAQILRIDPSTGQPRGAGWLSSFAYNLDNQAKPDSQHPMPDRKTVEPFAPVLVHLRQGAAMLPGLKRKELDLSSHADLVKSSSAALITGLVVWEARALRAEGTPGRAVDVLLDGMVFSGDLVRGDGLNGEAVADWMWARLLTELRDLLASRQLSKEELSGVGSALAALDESFPSHEPVMNAVVTAAGSSFLEHGEYVVYHVSIGRTIQSASGQRNWRYGFSKRLICAEAFFWADAWTGRLSGIDRMSWAEATRLQKELMADIQASASSVIYSIGSLLDPERAYGRRLALARLRLLRMTAVTLATGEFSDLDDPFGTKLLHEMTKDGFKVWSVGFDGGDDEGVGAWEDHRARDIVVEVGK